MSPEPQIIARWDLDKTYLRTDFDTFGALMRTALERPDQKRSVPGAAALLRELNRLGTRLHIVSGSPRQLRGRLEEKLALDGVRYAELSLKPNLANLLRLRFRALRDQLGYKLPVLLQARVRDQARFGQLHEVLSGDDAEADAFVYSLYADVVRGIIDKPTLEKILTAGRVFPDQLRAALTAMAALRTSGDETRILIHLDRQSPPSQFQRYAPRLVPFYNYQQAAYVLLEDGSLDGEGALRVAQNMMLYHQFDADMLARSYTELARRGHVRCTLGAKLEQGALKFRASEPYYEQIQTLTRSVVERAAELATRPPAQKSPPAFVLSPANYLELARHHPASRRPQSPRA